MLQWVVKWVWALIPHDASCATHFHKELFWRFQDMKYSLFSNSVEWFNYRISFARSNVRIFNWTLNLTTPRSFNSSYNLLVVPLEQFNSFKFRCWSHNIDWFCIGFLYQRQRTPSNDKSVLSPLRRKLTKRLFLGLDVSTRFVLISKLNDPKCTIKLYRGLETAYYFLDFLNIVGD